MGFLSFCSFGLIIETQIYLQILAKFLCPKRKAAYAMLMIKTHSCTLCSDCATDILPPWLKCVLSITCFILPYYFPTFSVSFSQSMLSHELSFKCRSLFCCHHRRTCHLRRYTTALCQVKVTVTDETAYSIVQLNLKYGTCLIGFVS